MRLVSITLEGALLVLTDLINRINSIPETKSPKIILTDPFSEQAISFFRENQNWFELYGTINQPDRSLTFSSIFAADVKKKLDCLPNRHVKRYI